jgi:hypothetical protein
MRSEICKATENLDLAKLQRVNVIQMVTRSREDKKCKLKKNTSSLLPLLSFLCLTGLKMIIGVAFCGCQAAKVTIYSEDEIGVKRRR